MSPTIQQAEELYKPTSEKCVLLTFATKHGATRDIAVSIAVQLRMDDLDVDMLDVSDVTNVSGYAAVVLGSAVYMGKLLPEVREFVAKFESELQTTPLWLFSSGPVGEDPKPKGEPTEAEELARTLHARGHTTFTGRLDKKQLGLGEKIAVKLVGAPDGDFRDWDTIEAWARDIAYELNKEKVR
ncbi:MAG: flavodoxin domain-containing protein [Chloroflexota bacterium]